MPRVTLIPVSWPSRRQCRPHGQRNPTPVAPNSRHSTCMSQENCFAPWTTHLHHFNIAVLIHAGAAVFFEWRSPDLHSGLAPLGGPLRDRRFERWRSAKEDNEWGLRSCPPLTQSPGTGSQSLAGPSPRVTARAVRGLGTRPCRPWLARGGCLVGERGGAGITARISTNQARCVSLTHRAISDEVTK
jgi:hypothetical protein